MKRQKKTKKKKSWLKIISITLLIFLAAGGAYAYSVYHSLTKAVNTMHTPIEDRPISEKRQKEIAYAQKEPFSVLILGVDERDGDSGRSDTMIVLTVNPDTNSVKMLSIPRDTRTDIIGKNKVDKINHAYAFGGVKMSMDTVENFLDIPLDYYVKINMEGFQDIVDSVGGVEVNNDLDFSYGGDHFPIGKIKLDGAEALNFSRMRYEDPRGDFGRQYRQREIIQGVINKGASFATLTNYSTIFDALSKNIETNLTFSQMNDIQKHYRTAAKKVEQMEMKSTGKRIDGIYYGIVSNEEKQRIHDELKAHLELK
ncbi:polyisoprenyl-teichoic acid--peptidoglycan teichoic acid transferase TagU [Peribacillus huizhouensis]|uniref:Polyisoprenyl-teichoic acid--peptidoglycan teichoic acid transferase TagU n=1 Tax=Peribacillus huizhouensis TaxID=1501239 RepID=A0ABR6CKJ6_9BACI|nr:LytR family transcriptional regulator [Peribacillus huizhouensis]MBA9025550.1 LCP family protein required for cell wall assembly [Peribacillus huizhouensis]